MAKALNSQLREAGFISCTAVSNQFISPTQLYKFVAGHRQWWMFVYEVFAH